MEKRPRETLDKERCLAFINKLWEVDHLAMFHHPVSATEVPGYYDVITSPVDLSTIKAGIEQGKYATDADVQDDVARMIANALEFNETGSEYFQLAKRMRKEYLSLAQQCGLAVDADAVFIPTKKARDDESTLRKAEAKYSEKLADVLGDLEKEKEIPLEELRKRYNRGAVGGPTASEDSGASGSDEEDSDGSEDDDDSDDEESEDESDSGSDSSSDEDSDEDEESEAASSSA